MNGQTRIIIENVQPQVENGLYHAKRTVGERVDVKADIFGDGHDHIRARILYKKTKDSAWKSVEMACLGNDAWLASFYVDEKGEYIFTVAAWIDHFDTWYDGIKKKIEANLNVKLELQEGAIMLKKLSGGKKIDLLLLASQFESSDNYDRSVNAVLQKDFAGIVQKNPFVEFETVYEKQLHVTVEHKKANFSSWYELFPRSTTRKGKHGTFQDVAKVLPRIAAMGFDVLYMPPIHPIGKINRKGKNNTVTSLEGEPGSPWAIGSDEGGHKAIHPALGTLDDFKKLLANATKSNIDIALDIAFQCAPDHPYVTEHPEWFKQRPDGTIQYAENPPKKYQDIYPFNFECEEWEELWQELKSVIFYWIDQGVRIFRVDNPHTKPIPFWQWVIDEVNKYHDDIIFLSEAFTRPKIMASLAKNGFTQSYTYFTWRVSKTEIIEYMLELVNSASREYFRPNFWPNTPDILPFHLQHQGENIFITRLVLAATLCSNYGIYGPAYEFYDNKPIEGREEYLDSEKFEIKDYEWKKTNRITDIITAINKARREHAALQSTWNIQFCTIENPNIIAFLKATDDLSSIVLVIINLHTQTRQSGYVQLPRASLKLKDHVNVKLHDLLTDEHYTWTQEWNYIEIDPYKIPFHLFKVEILESNM